MCGRKPMDRCLRKDGHVRAAPYRIDRNRANVKRIGCAEEADPFLFSRSLKRPFCVNSRGGIRSVLEGVRLGGGHGAGGGDRPDAPLPGACAWCRAGQRRVARAAPGVSMRGRAKQGQMNRLLGCHNVQARLVLVCELGDFEGEVGRGTALPGEVSEALAGRGDGYCVGRREDLRGCGCGTGEWAKQQGRLFL